MTGGGEERGVTGWETRGGLLWMRLGGGFSCESDIVDDMSKRSPGVRWMFGRRGEGKEGRYPRPLGGPGLSSSGVAVVNRREEKRGIKGEGQC